MIIDFFDHSVKLFPNHLAFVDDNYSLTYRETGDITHHIATRLRATPGLGKGTHVAILSPNDAYAFVCLLGTYRAEMVYVTVNTRDSLERNLEVLNQFDVEFLFYHSQFEKDIDRIRQAVPGIKDSACIDKGALDHWLEGYRERFRLASDELDAVGAIYTTGGTTGKPKGAVHTHRDMVCSLLDAHAFFNMEAGTRHLLAAPMTHVAGVYALIHTGKGGTSYILQRPDLDVVMNMIQENRITDLFLPPTVIYMMLAHPAARSCDFSSLTCFISAGAPFVPEKFKEAVGLFGPCMCNAYGQSEANALISCLTSDHYLNPDGSFNESRLKSVGTGTLAQRVELMDDDGNILEELGERGEIVVGGPCRMKEYYKDPVATAEALAGGWLHTGDIGIRDEEGFVSIVDRKKEMIISGGFNVFPSEVEDVILQFAGVQQCAVVGVPDEKWGEAVKAVVTLSAGRTVDPAELIAFCKERLGSVKAPKTIDIWEYIPISPVGKVLRREVREHFWDETGRII
jgi:acyl-CoA synthetase (AMP-forming)/AMP-acid ligase II